MTVPVGVTNQIDTIITTTMKLLEEKGYTDTDRWSEETFDQDYRPVIHEMIEKIYKLGKKEAVERLEEMSFKDLMVYSNSTVKEDNLKEILHNWAKEMLEDLSTPTTDE